MGIHTAQWLVANRVIFAYAYGTHTKEEMRMHNSRMLDLLDRSDHLVHALLVTHPDTILPKASLTGDRDILTFLRHEKLGWSVVVHNPDSIMARLSMLIARIMRVKYRQFDNVQIALDFLKRIDTTVDWENADMSLLSVLDF